MDETKIEPGYQISNPVSTKEECEQYAKMVSAIIEHNKNVDVGEPLWGIDEQESCYTVVETGAQTEEPKAPSFVAEQIAALQSAQSDTDSLMVDLAYRQTMLELGLDPEE